MKTKFKRHLVEQCAPTLAGIKVGSLFHYTAENGDDIKYIIRYWNKMLFKKGIQLCLVKEDCNGGLIYVFRPAMLSKLLLEKNINNFLKNYGFDDCYTPDTYIDKLQYHFSNESCFPHEIGIFLGYPLHDVQGFIANKGKGFRLCGFWKVYAQKHQAEKLFAQYRKCIDIYKTKFEKGIGIQQLTVAI